MFLFTLFSFVCIFPVISHCRMPRLIPVQDKEGLLSSLGSTFFFFFYNVARTHTYQRQRSVPWNLEWRSTSVIAFCGVLSLRHT